MPTVLLLINVNIFLKKKKLNIMNRRTTSHDNIINLLLFDSVAWYKTYFNTVQYTLYVENLVNIVE